MTMLQFSATLYTATARLTPRSSWHFAAFIANNSSTAASSEQSVVSVKEENNVKFSELQNNILQKEKDQKSQKIGTQTNFYSSGKKWLNESDKIFTKQFQAATSVNDLLDLAIIPNLSTVNALKLISSITNQINSGKSQIVNVEADERFIHLRKIVQFGSETKNISLSDDLSKYSQLSTPAMIAVIARLREQGKRHTPLLRLLSYNIVKYNVKLNLKQCASLLYSMAVLNFPDMILLGKIVTDLLEGIPKNTKAITNKSIITSLGFLHFKNERVLDAFSDTLYAESINYKFQDYSSILQTFAALQYNTEKSRLFIKKFAELANQYQTDSAEWLDIVWSLAVLDAVQPWHIESVLNPKFVDNLIISTKLNVSKKLKLLNINGVAQFILKDYKGRYPTMCKLCQQGKDTANYLPILTSLNKNNLKLKILDMSPSVCANAFCPFLSTDVEVFKNIPLVRAKEKQMYVEALSETLKKLLPSSSYFKTNLDTNMGFLLDAEYRIDDQYKLIKVENWDEQSTNVKRIGIMIHDYHDYCRGQNDLIGSAYLYTQLLKARRYNLITISYENFSIQDKIDKRVKYLKECMNSVQHTTST